MGLYSDVKLVRLLAHLHWSETLQLSGILYPSVAAVLIGAARNLGLLETLLFLSSQLLHSHYHSSCWKWICSVLGNTASCLLLSSSKWLYKLKAPTQAECGIGIMGLEKTVLKEKWKECNITCPCVCSPQLYNLLPQTGMIHLCYFCDRLKLNTYSFQ